MPHMFMHVYNRINLVGDPFSDPYNQGFQMIHSYYALFNGGLTGLSLETVLRKRLYQLRKPIYFSVLVENLACFSGFLLLAYYS